MVLARGRLHSLTTSNSGSPGPIIIQEGVMAREETEEVEMPQPRGATR